MSLFLAFLPSVFFFILTASQIELFICSNFSVLKWLPTLPGEKSHYNGLQHFLYVMGLNSALHTCKAGTLPLEPRLQSILVWLFWRWESHELFTQAVLKQ
jgi:hypothetical protein